MIYLTKKSGFSAAHRLFNPELNSEDNETIYNKCANYYGHGHNYDIEVTVKGHAQAKTGWIIDLKLLQSIINEEIIDKVDHKHLNFDVDFLKGIIPTVENIVVCFWRILENKIPGAKLHKIRLYETNTSYADYYGEDVEVHKYDL